MVKNPSANVGSHKRYGFSSWVGEIPWNRRWKPTSVFLPGKFHGQRSLVGHHPGGHKEWEGLSNWASMHNQLHKMPPYFAYPVSRCQLSPIKADRKPFFFSTVKLSHYSACLWVSAKSQMVVDLLRESESVSHSCPTLDTPWTVAHQAPLTMESSRQEYWSGLPFPSSGDLPNSGIKSVSCIAGRLFYRLSHQGSKLFINSLCFSLL